MAGDPNSVPPSGGHHAYGTDDAVHHATESLGRALAGLNLTAPGNAATTTTTSNWGLHPISSSSSSTEHPTSSPDSIEQFLAQDPRQALGPEVFRFTSSEQVVSPTATTGFSSFLPNTAAATSLDHHVVPRNYPDPSRTVSPPSYASNPPAAGGHWIAPYPHWDATTTGATTTAAVSSSSSASSTPLSWQQNKGNTILSSFQDPPHHAPNAPVLRGSEQNYNQQPFDDYHHFYGNGNLSPQVLYMAVPCASGRGQVLQPVQVLPGAKSNYPYLLPAPAAAAAPDLRLGTDWDGMRRPPDQDAATRSNSTHGGHYRFPLNDYHDSSDGGAPVVSGSVVVAGISYTADNGLYAPTQQQRPPLEALVGQIRRLSRDQVGCRLVQQALDEEGPAAATMILDEGLPFWGEAMIDPFGNYLFQKILERITPEERIVLVGSVSSRLVNASLNLHGTRSVQKVVELCAQDQDYFASRHGRDRQGNLVPDTAASILTQALAPAAARLCIDSHGNHVIQRIILKLHPPLSRFVFDAVAASVGDVARHRHGCCVIQRCLDSPASDARSHLVQRIVEKSLELMQDAYGNYVVQYVLDVCADHYVQAVCESVVGRVSLLAIQKFSSNVLEKCLERCSDRVREAMIAEMCDAERIRELMMDPFGNYVVQRALAVATHEQAVRLVEAMRPHLSGNSTTSFRGGVRHTAGGRRIIAKICRRFPNFTLTDEDLPRPLYQPRQAPLYGGRMGNSRLDGPPLHGHLQQQRHQQQQQEGTLPYYNASGNPYMDHFPGAFSGM
jgi:Pumilio-family RNA binding repeat